MIRGAAAGRPADREGFARHYTPVVRAYLLARWRQTTLIQDVDDAVQEVFVECFKDGGAVERASEECGGSFSAYLYGIVRNVARMAERRRYRRKDPPADQSFDPDAFVADEQSLGTVFDRAWATGVIRQAGALQRRRAAENGDGARKRVEILRLRFQEGLPILEIAELWGEDAPRLHHEYAKARKEFREALVAVASFHHPGDPAEVERECARLLDLLD